MKKIAILLCCLLWSGGSPGFLLYGQAPIHSVPYTVNITGTPAPGCMLMAPFSASLVDAYPANLMVLDSAGELIWYAALDDATEAPYDNAKTTDFKMLPDGRYAYWIEGEPESWYILNSEFELVDSVRCEGFELTDDHDLLVDADGNFHLLCDSIVTRDLSPYTTGDGFPGNPNGLVLYQIVQTLDSNKNFVRNWEGIDHLPYGEIDPDHWTNNYFMDYMHTNSISVSPEGDFVLSNRNLCEITAFNPLTGQVTWRLGGLGNEFTLVGDTAFFDAQHDANFTPEGNLYLFDNGTLGGKDIARYVEYELDHGNKTATLVREILHPAQERSRFMGNAIHLPDGGIIISWGGLDNVDDFPQITEYDAGGNVVMEIDIENPFLTYRIYKDPRPWSLPRPELSCNDADQTLSAPAGYDSYRWNTGETTATISVSDPGEYQVWVNQGIGFISSRKVTVADPSQTCLALTQPEPTSDVLQLFPNPSQDQVTLRVPGQDAGRWDLEVFDALGKAIYTSSGNGPQAVDLDISLWPPGVYYVRLTTPNHTFQQKLLRP